MNFPYHSNFLEMIDDHEFKLYCKNNNIHINKNNNILYLWKDNWSVEFTPMFFEILNKNENNYYDKIKDNQYTKMYYNDMIKHDLYKSCFEKDDINNMLICDFYNLMIYIISNAISVSNK
jgi:hypothetical protein